MSLTHCLCVVLFCRNVALGYLMEQEDKPSQSAQELTPATFEWESGIVPYKISKDYDNIIVDRIRSAMHTIETTSCVVFKEVGDTIPSPWLSIENPEGVRECTHTTFQQQGSGPNRFMAKAVLIIGYDCMERRDILHALLHALSFRDEVTHPQRDMYVRVMWSNIQPKYRSLFWIHSGDMPYKMVEYDSMSIMHFHDRAFSINGGATLTPVIPGLLIAPSDKLSQLDVMKLRLAFDHECNKRKVGGLLQTCQNAFQSDSSTVEHDGQEETEDEPDSDLKPCEKGGTEVEEAEEGATDSGTREHKNGQEETEEEPDSHLKLYEKGQAEEGATDSGTMEHMGPSFAGKPSILPFLIPKEEVPKFGRINKEPKMDNRI